MEGESTFLKKRAEEFWERASEDFQKRRYNLAALDTEQTIQLWLKYLIFKKAGDFPKTHYLDTLVNNLVEVYDLPAVEEFYKKNLLQFKSLEDSYLTSRYLPKEFSKLEAQEFIDFAQKFLAVLEETTNEKLV